MPSPKERNTRKEVQAQLLRLNFFFFGAMQRFRDQKLVSVTFI